MKNTKLIIAILVAFAVGVAFTKIFLKKEAAGVEKSEEESKDGSSEIELKAKSQPVPQHWAGLAAALVLEFWG